MCRQHDATSSLPSSLGEIWAVSLPVNVSTKQTSLQDKIQVSGWNIISLSLSLSLRVLHWNSQIIKANQLYTSCIFKNEVCYHHDSMHNVGKTNETKTANKCQLHKCESKNRQQQPFNTGWCFYSPGCLNATQCAHFRVFRAAVWKEYRNMLRKHETWTLSKPNRCDKATY